jgi:ribonuclease VapC
MVIDTSALVAILTDEPERPALARALDADRRRLLSGASLLEATLVIESRYGDAGGRELDLLVHRSGMVVVDVTADQIEVARTAWRSFGKGRHRAGLNFGDCFSYALAMQSREPLLFVGDDFAHTDVVAVDWTP